MPPPGAMVLLFALINATAAIMLLMVARTCKCLAGGGFHVGQNTHTLVLLTSGDNPEA